MTNPADEEMWIVSRNNTFVAATTQGTVLRAGGREFTIPAASLSEREIRDALTALATPRRCTSKALSDLSSRAVTFLLASGSLFRGALPAESPVTTYLIRNYPDPAQIDALLRSRRPLESPDCSGISHELQAVMGELLPSAIPREGGPILAVNGSDPTRGYSPPQDAFHVTACPSWRSPGEVLLVGSHSAARVQEFHDASGFPELALRALGRPHVSRLAAIYLLLMWIDTLSVQPRLPRAYAVTPELEVIPLRLESSPIWSNPVDFDGVKISERRSVQECISALMSHRSDSASVLIEPKFPANGTRVELRLATVHGSVTASGHAADLAGSLLAAVSTAFAQLGASLGVDVTLAHVGSHPIGRHWPVYALNTAGLVLTPARTESNNVHR